jgi:hypothetical protein
MGETKFFCAYPQAGISASVSVISCTAEHNFNLISADDRIRTPGPKPIMLTNAARIFY